MSKQSGEEGRTTYEVWCLHWRPKNQTCRCLIYEENPKPKPERNNKQKGLKDRIL